MPAPVQAPAPVQLPAPSQAPARPPAPAPAPAPKPAPLVASKPAIRAKPSLETVPEPSEAKKKTPSMFYDDDVADSYYSDDYYDGTFADEYGSIGNASEDEYYDGFLNEDQFDEDNQYNWGSGFYGSPGQAFPGQMNLASNYGDIYRAGPNLRDYGLHHGARHGEYHDVTPDHRHGFDYTKSYDTRQKAFQDAKFFEDMYGYGERSLHDKPQVLLDKAKEHGVADPSELNSSFSSYNSYGSYESYESNDINFKINDDVEFTLATDDNYQGRDIDVGVEIPTDFDPMTHKDIEPPQRRRHKGAKPTAAPATAAPQVAQQPLKAVPVPAPAPTAMLPMPMPMTGFPSMGSMDGMMQG